MKIFNLLTLCIMLFNISYGRIVVGSRGTRLTVDNYGKFSEPWAMTMLPSGKILITEKSGNLILFDAIREKKIFVKGVPKVAYGGQGGLGDIVLHPKFKENALIYFTYVEEGSKGKRGAVVARAKLLIRTYGASLKDLEIIWKQYPKVTGSGHYSHRLAFDSDAYLYIASGDRQKQEPAQNWTGNLGKIIRLNDDGSVPGDNPFQNRGELAKTFWTKGHRNILGMDFDESGRLWAHEMGPKDGDEFNLIIKGDNYGWPLVSWGDQYSGASIPDHDTRPEFHSPEAYWVPTIAPSGLVIYSGDMFSQWKGNALIGGLRSRALIRVAIDKDRAYEVERFDFGKRIREVEEGLYGEIWLLEDQQGGRLLRVVHEE